MLQFFDIILPNQQRRGSQKVIGADGKVIEIKDHAPQLVEEQPTPDTPQAPDADQSAVDNNMATAGAAVVVLLAIALVAMQALKQKKDFLAN